MTTATAQITDEIIARRDSIPDEIRHLDFAIPENIAALVGIVKIIEGCAGPGGWTEALRLAGRTDSVGLEWTEDACETARANGHLRINADVSMFDLRPFRGTIEGLIFSPPCQSFSSAGKGLGKLDRPRIEKHARRVMAAGRWLHYSREGWHDDRSPLILEPLRYAFELRPQWIALEQVPGVLPMWELFAEVLASIGYFTATGVLSAEQYGVPQTRKRAFLAASLSGPVSLPAPTHRPYRKGKSRDEGDPRLLQWVSMADALGWATGGVAGFPRADSGDVITLDDVDYRARDLRPTDAPAQALTEKVRSWLATGTRPNSTKRPDDEPAPGLAFGNDAASHVWMDAEPESPGDVVAAKLPAMTKRQGAGRTERYGPRPDREAGEPAFTLTTGGGDGGGTGHVPLWTEDPPMPDAIRTGNFTAIARDADGGRSAAGSVPYERTVDAPAPTVRAASAGEWVRHGEFDGEWVYPEGDVVGEAHSEADIVGMARNAGPGAQRDPRSLDDPAFTMRANGSGSHPSGTEWIAPVMSAAGATSPQTAGTVPRTLDEPGATITGKGTAAWHDGDKPACTVAGDPRIAKRGHHDRQMNGAVRVSVQEAAVLQSFRPDYEWRGSKTGQYRQVGDAVPPVLGAAVLTALFAQIAGHANAAPTVEAGAA